MNTTRRALLCTLTLIAATSDIAAADPATGKVVEAANAFLATLDDAQRERVQFQYNDEQQRVRWSNLPVSMVKRSGVALQELNDAQRTAAMALLATALSKPGFEKIEQIVAGDEVLKTSQRNTPMFGSGLYYLSLLGKPSLKDPWMVQFGGHHLGLNLTIAGDQGVLTPTLTGAQPALYTIDGKTVRPLGRESDKAVALLSALDESQRKQAILGYELADLVLGPGQDGKTIQPEGLQASAMNAKQRALLTELIAEWAGIVHDAAAARRMKEIEADLDRTWFAWSGPIEVTPGRNIAAYYRVQGPKLVIEYAPQRLGGDATLHVHAMYRDPTNDYGRKPAGK